VTTGPTGLASLSGRIPKIRPFGRYPNLLLPGRPS
jgi:hypothetical protein